MSNTFDSFCTRLMTSLVSSCKNSVLLMPRGTFFLLFPGSFFMLILRRISWMLLVLVKVGITKQCKLKIKLEICFSILNSQVEASLTCSPAPDFHHLLETAKEEGFIRQAAGRAP